jgi:hypothetical protein
MPGAGLAERGAGGPRVHTRGRGFLGQGGLTLCTHSSSPCLESKVPFCRLTSLSVKRGPHSCRRAITGDCGSTPPLRPSRSSKMYLRHTHPHSGPTTPRTTGGLHPSTPHWGLASLPGAGWVAFPARSSVCVCMCRPTCGAAQRCSRAGCGR